MTSLPPLTRLILAYAPARERTAYGLIWAFDARLADVIRSTSEPMIGHMRIAWWDEALADDDGVRGRGEPLLEAMRAEGVARRLALPLMLDGWEALLNDPMDDEALRQFAQGRGAGLFHTLADVRDPPLWLAAAGRLWALWDMSGHIGDAGISARAVALAQAEIAMLADASWPKSWKAMRLLTGLARHDVMRGRAATGLTPGLYARLLRLSLTGG